MRKHRSQRAVGAGRVTRRETLKGLGALAIAAAGCSSEEMLPGGGGGAGTGPTTGGGAGQPAAGGAAAGANGGAGRSSAAMSGSGAAGSAAAGASGDAAGASGGGAGTAGQAGGVASNGGAGGASGAGGAGASPLDSLQCIVTPAMTEGPFFKDEVLDRSDLVDGETADAIVKAVPLRLVIGVFDVEGMSCAPVSGVQVDIWHADALGVYSDVAPGVVQSVDTRGQKFLRGYQVTDEQGVVAFDTIYPGWYMSRTIHIHFKLRRPGAQGGASEFTSQMFFDEAVNAVVLAKAPYSAHPGMRSVLNDGDHIYNGTATNSQKPPAGTTPPGKSIIPVLAAMGAGYSATLKIGLRS